MAMQQTLDYVALAPGRTALPRGAAPIQWENLDGSVVANCTKKHVDAETLVLRIELGCCRMDHEQAVALRKGAIVVLDTAADAPVNLYAGGRLIGRGEVLVLDGRIAVRVLELSDSKDARACR